MASVISKRLAGKAGVKSLKSFNEEHHDGKRFLVHYNTFSEAIDSMSYRREALEGREIRLIPCKIDTRVTDFNSGETTEELNVDGVAVWEELFEDEQYGKYRTKNV